MQSTHKISGDAAAGFAAYLTAGASRGDYYAADGDDDTTAHGAWHGSERALGVLGLDPARAVSRGELVALMRGVSPADGSAVRPVGASGSRVAGIDLTFSAPKSVSALWAVSDDYRRAQVEAAHRAAVASARERIEREVAVVRRREGGVVRWEPARSLVAAEFVHTASRLTADQEAGAGVPDPQLHSHLVVLAAERADGRFAAVDSRELFRSARVNGAWYRAELAWRLGELGLEVRGRAGRDGRYFELAGVPQELAVRWSARAEVIDREAARFRGRYGREPSARELDVVTVRTRGSKTLLEQPDVHGVWRAVGEEYGLSTRRARGLFGERARVAPARDLGSDLVGALGRERSMVSRREVEARAYELAAGVMQPARAHEVVSGLIASGELVALRDGMFTTRELRELEQRTVQVAAARREELAAPVSSDALVAARRGVVRELGSPLSGEQREALQTITGLGGVSVLVGQAGTGKGVVLGAASAAWRSAGYEGWGTAIAGATAKRLGADAKFERSLTSDALLHRLDSGSVRLGYRSVVVMDEAGMADTRRLARLVEQTDRANAKLVLVGDEAQLGAIGAGGLFGAIEQQVPSAELSEVRRAQHEWERDAWAQVRAGDADRALASYRAHDRLHVEDSREEAAARMVDAWDGSRHARGCERSVMLTDASNRELDEINALAQQRRAERGELGSQPVDVRDRPYSLLSGDEVMFIGAVYPPGQERVENGTLGVVSHVESEQGLWVRTREGEPRDVALGEDEAQRLRLAYAQHVYKAQGLTVDRAFVLTGGWQTDRERAYVALTRARESTEVFVSRDELGEEGLDDGAIERLGERIAVSHAQRASVSKESCPDRGPASEKDAVRSIGRNQTVDSTLDVPLREGALADDVGARSGHVTGGAQPPAVVVSADQLRGSRSVEDGAWAGESGAVTDARDSAAAAPLEADGLAGGRRESEAGRLLREAREREENEIRQGSLERTGHAAAVNAAGDAPGESPESEAGRLLRESREREERELGRGI